jgi:hypothetical protein
MSGSRARDERGQSGQALAELGIVVMVTMFVAVAVFDLALGFFNSTLIVQGARDGARVAMDCNKSVTDIQNAALAVAPSGATVVVVPDPRPTCPPSNSSTAETTVTVSFTHSWMLPFWSTNGTASLTETARSR